MKRLNVKLLVWLIVTPAVLAVGVHFLHAYQIDRNADTLKSLAEDAAKAGDTDEAIKQYAQYLKHRRNDAEAFGKLAGLAADAADKPDAPLKKVREAFFIMEEAVRRHENLSDVRKRLVTYCMKFGRFKDAMDHIDRLRADKALDGTDFDIKYAQCLLATGRNERAVKLLCDLVGYDPAKEEFQQKKARGAHEIDPYVMLASIYISQQFDSKDAQLVIDQLVAANPDNAQALAARGRFRLSQGKFDAARPDLEKSLEMAPDDAEIIILNAQAAALESNLERAETLLDEGLKKHPGNANFYLVRANLAHQQKKTDEAQKFVDEGLKHAPKSQALLVFRADLEIEAGDIDGARATVAQMKDAENEPEMIALIDCNILMAEKKWGKAVQQLEKLRPLMGRSAERTKRIDLALGQCFMKQGQPDRALDAFTRALDNDPLMSQAQAGKAQALIAMGKSRQAEEILRNLQGRVASKTPQPTVVALQEVQKAVAEELKKPESKRDWVEVDLAVNSLVQSGNLKDAEKAVFQAQVAMIKKDLPRARGLLSAAAREFPKEWAVWNALTVLVAQDKDSKYSPEDVLNRAEKELGNIYPIRAKRLQIAVGKPADEAKPLLKEIELGLDELKANERDAITAELGGAYYRLRDYENARRLFTKIAESSPEDSKHWQILFDLAREFNSEADMDATIESIRKNRGPNSTLLALCKAQKILWQVRNQKADASELAKAKEFLDDARKIRPQWHEIARIAGEISEQEGKADDAIGHFRRSLELGPSNPAIARRLISLLAAQGRVAEVDEVMKTIPTLAEADPLKKLQVDKSLREGKIDEALVDAKKHVDADPDNYSSQLWYGQLLSRAGQDAEAQKAFRTAIEKDPQGIQGWLMLVSHLTNTKQNVDANGVIKEAVDKINPEVKTLFTAQAYAMLNDLKQAEASFEALLAEKPEDLATKRTVAGFYLGTKNSEKGKALVESILKSPAASDPKATEVDVANVQWARRAMAQIVASTDEYLDLQEALNVLKGNAQNGKLPPEDLMLSAALLAKRPEYVSRVAAVKALEKVQEARALAPQEQFVLAELYEQIGDWSKARETVVNVLSKVEGNPGLSAAYASMLIKHNELLEAERWIEKIEQAQPDSPLAVQMRARLVAAQGDVPKAEELFSKFIEKAPNDQSRLQAQGIAVGMLEEIQAYSAAEKILRDVVAREPRANFSLAFFLGRHGNLDEAFELLEQSRKSQSLLAVIQAGVDIVRRRQQEAGKQHFAKIESWMQAANDEEANSPTMQLHRAELLDIQGKTAEVISTYRQLYNQAGLQPKQKAIIANNLSFVLAMSGDQKNAEEALKLINEAIDVLGPSSDLLDTRAVCYLLMGNTKQAIADAKAAVVDSPTPVKYLHLAFAEATAGDKTAAKQSLNKARDAKLDVNALPAKERTFYDKLIQIVEAK